MATRETRELVSTESSANLSPFAEFERWFESAWRRPLGFLRPTMWPIEGFRDFETGLLNVDIFEDKGDLVMKAELPGMKKEDVSIELQDNVLTISGEKKKEDKVEKGKFFRHERVYGSVSRRFELPYDIDVEKIPAHMEDGVLEIRLPKTAKVEEKSRSIPISTD